MNDVIVGFSVNPEIVGVYNSFSTSEKLTLSDFRVDLSGAAGDVAIALQKLAVLPYLLGLAGKDGSAEDVLLKWVLAQTHLPFEVLPVLDKASIALLPVDPSRPSRVIGRTGTLIQPVDMVDEEKVAVLKVRMEEAVGKISAAVAASPRAWRIATGVRVSEVNLAKVLFEDALQGTRVLSPHHSACTDDYGLDALGPLLREADLLILNEQEFISLTRRDKLSFMDFHAMGVKLIIITKAERGGFFSLWGECEQFFATPSPRLVSGVGAGDWFLAGLLSEFIRQGVCLDEDHSDPGKVRESIAFATRVAAKKITMPGAANGPSLAELSD